LKIEVRVKIENSAEWQEINLHHSQALKCYSFSQDAANQSRCEDKVNQLWKNSLSCELPNLPFVPSR